MNEQQRLRELFTSFREVNQAYYQAIQQITGSNGITPIQFFTLRMLSEHPNIGLNELAERIRSTSSTASGIIDRMVKAGWVSRNIPDTDRRSVELKLTGKGEEMCRRIEEIRTNRLSGLSEIPEEDHNHLLRILGNISQILHKSKEGDPHD
ncbi:hypothetical protein SD71_21035 [Cohnella kolymensis]|uniref:HTH marR-type domain-containing protein n=1 Tax=Cohnella kolymensis TaxID=1590652 RepID=A0ABR4ZZQ3_9BACL|nr:MarR family transcriptional regulator [Cohnella kolymensis]KIL34162.1 hypothetical protein SD71_21035 [Cohnella kolymensis]